MIPPDTRPDDMGFCGSDVEHCGWVDGPQDGRVGSAETGSHPADHAPLRGHGAPRFDPARDGDAVCAAWRGGESQRGIARRYGVAGHRIGTIIQERIGSSERREINERRRLRKSLAYWSKHRADRLERGDIPIERNGDVIVVVVGGLRFLLDASDEAIFRRHSWQATSNKRLIRQERQGGRRYSVYIYHDILGVAPSRKQVVDHINRDPTDNRRVNLRICSYSENSRNRGPRHVVGSISHPTATSLNEA